MKKKIIRKKRNVKKKVAKKLPAFNNPEQWGSAFENLRHQAHEFNLLSKLGRSKAGDPFSAHGVPDKSHEDTLDAIRYYNESNRVAGTSFLVGNEERPDPALRKNGAPPAHYAHGKIEPWDVVKDWDLDYFTGCAMKYVCRHKHKGTPEQDIQKAIDYLVEYKKTLTKETI
jgi:hypothetical protein